MPADVVDFAVDELHQVLDRIDDFLDAFEHDVNEFELAHTAIGNARDDLDVLRSCLADVSEQKTSNAVADDA